MAVRGLASGMREFGLNPNSDAPVLQLGGESESAPEAGAALQCGALVQRCGKGRGSKTKALPPMRTTVLPSAGHREGTQPANALLGHSYRLWCCD